MVKILRLAIFAFLIFPYQTSEAIVTLIAISGAAAAVSGLITFGVFVGKQVRNYERKLSDPAYRGENIRRPFDRAESNIFDQLQYLSKRRDQFIVDVENFKNEEIERLTENVPTLVELLRRLSIVFVDSITVDKAYDNFLEYLTEPNKYDRNMILKFAKDTLSENNCGLKHLLIEIRTLLLESSMASPSGLNLFVQNNEVRLWYYV